MNKMAVLCMMVVLLDINSFAQTEEPPAYILAGSGTNVYITEVLAKAFMANNPLVKIKVLPSVGSTGGIRAAHKGKINIGLAGRHLREIEKTWNLKVVPYARTLLVFGVNQSVQEDNISSDELKNIYEGTMNKWKDKSSIIVLMREEGDNGAEVLMKHFNWAEEVFKRAWNSGVWRIEYKDEDCNNSIKRIKGSIGWTDLGIIMLKRYSIKILKLNGVEPTFENLTAGRYPLFKELSFVYSGQIEEPLQKFISFVKSRQGAEILRKNGYEPVP